MTRFPVVLVAMAVAVWPPAAVAGQEAGRPIAELGIHGALGAAGPVSSAGPHVVVNFGPRTSVEFSVDRQIRRNDTVRDHVYVQLRQTLVHLDRGAFFATVGGLRVTERETFRYSQYGAPFPDITYRDQGGGIITGIGVDRAIAPFAAIRAEAQIILAEPGIFARLDGGLSVPIGRYAAAPPPYPLPVSIARLATGQTVWVTTSGGMEVKGTVGARSEDGLTIRHRGGATRLALSEIVLIEAPDSLLNGTVIGAASGGISAGVFGLLLGAVLCEGEAAACALGGAMVLGGAGAGIGAVAGAITDSFVEGRQVVFRADRSGRVEVIPVFSTQGAGVAFRW
jgi:hypothetical protein